MRPRQSSPTKTLKGSLVSGLCYVVTGIDFRALREFHLLKGLKCIESVRIESQGLQCFHCFLPFWQDIDSASWSLVLKKCRNSCVKGKLCPPWLQLWRSDDQINHTESNGAFMRNRYFSNFKTLTLDAVGRTQCNNCLGILQNEEQPMTTAIVNTASLRDFQNVCCLSRIVIGLGQGLSKLSAEGKTGFRCFQSA